MHMLMNTYGLAIHILPSSSPKHNMFADGAIRTVVASCTVTAAPTTTATIFRSSADPAKQNRQPRISDRQTERNEVERHEIALLCCRLPVVWECGFSMREAQSHAACPSNCMCQTCVFSSLRRQQRPCSCACATATPGQAPGSVRKKCR